MESRMPDVSRKGQVSRFPLAPLNRMQPLDAIGRSPYAPIAQVLLQIAKRRSLNLVVYRRSVATALLFVSLVPAACKGESDEQRPSRGADERTILTLQSYVYAMPDDGSFRIAERVRDQVKSAFGAIRSFRITGSNREVSNAGGDQFYKEPLMVVSPDGREALVFRVWFRFTDEVFASDAVPRGAPLFVGGLHRQEDRDFTRIVTVCTPNSSKEREYKGRLQSVFDASLPGCQDAIMAEQSMIDAARVRLDDPEMEIVPEEFERNFVPVVARLMARKASQMGTYPRFESVVPQTGKVVASTFGVAQGRPDLSGDGASVLAFWGDGDGPKTERSDPIVIPNAGGVEPPASHRDRERRGDDDDDEHGADRVPDPQADIPVVVAAAPKGPSTGAPSWRNQGDHSWDWEDFADKKYWVLWLAVFGLYPLLKRRPGTS